MTHPRIRIALLGSLGRMGKHVTQLIEGEYSDRTVLSIAATRGAHLETLLHADVVIDFSSAAAIAELARQAMSVPRSHWPAFVVGSTGFSQSELQSIEELAHHTPVFMAANFSTGVHALLHALGSIAPLLKLWGYSPVILEKHHQYKKDAPSGTALSIASVIAPQDPKSVQTHSVRKGEIIGEHSVSFYGAAEELCFSHQATDRSVFARGALDVALWLHAQRQTLSTPPHSIWTMSDYFASQTQLAQRTAKQVAQKPGQSL